MKIGARFVLACVTGALVIGAGPMIRSALAQAAPKAEPIPYWWFHGEIEAGWRAFTNNPENNGQAGQAGKSDAKFFEYNAMRPGAFLNGHLSTGTNDGLYQVDLWAKNAGYDDQRFNLDASKAGEQYFNFEWDQTPHNYGSAQTIFNGVGSNNLTLPGGLAKALNTDCGNATACTNPAQVQKDINSSEHQADIGIRRDTGSVNYRWTPTTNWDVHVDYLHMHRTGTQLDGVAFGPGTSNMSISQVPRPVNDTTQNFGINGEYAGTSPWGKNFTFKLGYAGSVYTDKDESYTVADPFCPAGGVGTGGAPAGLCGGPANQAGGNFYAPSALMSLWPSNQSNGFSTTVGADLPWKSRYVGTISYNMMRQNEGFLPFTNNPTPYLGAPIVHAFPTLPASSLNGAINTLMVNNVMTTQMTPELKSKISYRYYNFDNDTPEILFPDYIITDTTTGVNRNSTYAPVHSLSISYVKQNAAADLNWRPDRQWNLGTGYGYERYNWTRADANTTNENSGKVYADWTPVKWVTARASWLYAERRYDMYDYYGNVGFFQWPNDTGASPNTKYNAAFRQFYLDNRDRNKGRLSVAVDVIPRLTVTPTFGWQLDDYKLNPNTEEGLQRDHSWNAGIEASYLLTPDTRLLFSYTNEQHSQIITSSGQSNPPFPAASYYSANVQDRVNTFIVSADHAFIPDKLDIKVSYTLSEATDSQPIYFMNGTQPGSGALGVQYPDVKTTWQRLEAMAKYKLDKETVQQLGWKGEVTAKLRYAWERNSVANWQNDVMQTYLYSIATTNSRMIWLAYDDPNYNVQMVTASLTFKW
jgi:MtrB/PioB family decaheme-associated outer membrane protein